MRDEMREEPLVGFAPTDFFLALEQNVLFIAQGEGPQMQLSQKYLLAPLGELLGQIESRDSYAAAFVGWHYSGLYFQIEVKTVNPISVSFPDIQQGDAIELFIDTRAQTLARTAGRFCHHFYFLPERFEGHEKGEITRFRTEDSHPLCPEELLELQITKRSQGYVAKIFIPKECLTGYDLQEGTRLGFSYRINRSGGPTLYFGPSSDYCRLEYLPSHWPTLRCAA